MKQRKQNQDLGSDRDGFGRPLSNPVNAALRKLCGGGVVKVSQQEIVAIKPDRAPIEAIDLTSLGPDVPDNKQIRQRLEAGYVLAPDRWEDKELAKAEAEKLREQGVSAGYVGLLHGKYGVFRK